MKTTKIMKRQMGEYEVLQRTSDSYFRADDLLRQWNLSHGGKNRRDMDRFFKSPKTKVLWPTLESDNFNIDFDYRHKNTWTVVEINKGENTRYGRNPDEIWMSTKMFLLFCKYININLYSEIYNYLIENGIIDGSNKIEVVCCRDEFRLCDVLKKANEVSFPEQNVYLQYPCLGSKYRLDALVEDKHDSIFFDGKESIRYTIIEYDESQHDTPKIKSHDVNREKEVTEYLYKLAIAQNRIPEISILRVKKGEEGYFYAYAIPYIIYINTSDCFDKMIETLDYRVLLDFEGYEEYVNYFGIDTSDCEKLINSGVDITREVFKEHGI